MIYPKYGFIIILEIFIILKPFFVWVLGGVFLKLDINCLSMAIIGLPLPMIFPRNLN